MKFMTQLGLAVILYSAASDAADTPKTPTLKVHPKVFSMVDCWISDSEAPVVTEFNLDALEANDNQFFAENVKREDGSTRSPNDDGAGFFRYRVLEAKDSHYKLEFQSNGGGSLTTAVIIDCSVEKREMKRDGKPKTIRVLRVIGFSSKS
jgi:hypothetical protein